jgi:hypothetical protein
LTPEDIMDGSLGALVNLYSFSTGRYIFALQQVLKAAQAQSGLATLVTHTQAGIQHGHETRVLENRYAEVQNVPKGNPKLVAIDVRLDRALVALRDAAQAHVDAGSDDDGDDAPDNARALLAAIFPKGVRDVTQSTFVEELSLVDGILDEIKTNHAATIDQLGLGRFVQRITQINEEYRAAQQEPASGGPNGSDVRAARARTQEFLLEVVSLVIGQFPLAEKKDIEARQKLLGPILVQNDAIGAYLRARRSVEDVNPDTGEVQPAPTAPATPPQPAPAAAGNK